ncbi:MAG: hypothetical protein K2P22_11395 [Lachnospiraceae bacterium]|nr:hypothetical protein [Lachnospiraceae bacterium]
MREIEKIKRYIERTKMGIKNPIQYAMNVAETLELLNMAQIDNPFGAISLAFNYGRAKGYRAAKAEGRARA